MLIDWTALCIYCIVYQCQINHANLSVPVTVQLRQRAKGLSLISPNTKHISNIHRHICTHKHMHTCSQLENCLVVMCHVCVWRDRLVGRQWEKAGAVCLNADKSLTLRQSVIFPLSHAVCFHILSSDIFFFLWMDSGSVCLIWFTAVLTVRNQIFISKKKGPFGQDYLTHIDQLFFNVVRFLFLKSQWNSELERLHCIFCNVTCSSAWNEMWGFVFSFISWNPLWYCSASYPLCSVQIYIMGGVS